LGTSQVQFALDFGHLHLCSGTMYIFVYKLPLGLPSTVIAVLDCYRDPVPNMCIYATCAYLIGKYSYASEYIYICFFCGKNISIVLVSPTLASSVSILASSFRSNFKHYHYLHLCSSDMVIFIYKSLCFH
jgi:hypothetical protein